MRGTEICHGSSNWRGEKKKKVVAHFLSLHKELESSSQSYRGGRLHSTKSCLCCGATDDAQVTTRNILEDKLAWMLMMLNCSRRFRLSLKGIGLEMEG